MRAINNMKFYYLVFEIGAGRYVGAMTMTGIGWADHPEAVRDGWVTLDYEEALKYRNEAATPSRWHVIAEEVYIE
jgi:hypothetical protein